MGSICFLMYNPSQPGPHQAPVGPANIQLQQFQQQIPTGIPVSYAGRSTTEIIGSLSGVFLKQEPDVIEAFLPYEKANKYTFFAIDAQGNKSDFPFLKAKEKSNVFARQFLGAGRGFEMVLKQVNGTMEVGDFMLLQKEAVCCRCDRGTMQVFLLEGGQRYLGSVYGPFVCCQIELQVYNANQQLRFIMKGSVCQLGVICGGCPCKSCRESYFELYDASGNILTTIRHFKDFWKSLVSDADDFSVAFPSWASLDDRCLLMAMLIMLDYSYFEQPPKRRGAYDNFRYSSFD
eukprot:TRINITY_DN8076_c0_g1_i1.p1 TRINITY_DN8076_c0_g1~~TRINITY_DN8076_c0_g1_i1.p1  ORF type:complete len:290 (-),score=47.86 TRINITY_DN8076_c0_g1_i1:174-1043(-)